VQQPPSELCLGGSLSRTAPTYSSDLQHGLLLPSISTTSYVINILWSTERCGELEMWPSPAVVSSSAGSRQLHVRSQSDAPAGLQTIRPSYGVGDHVHHHAYSSNGFKPSLCPKSLRPQARVQSSQLARALHSRASALTYQLQSRVDAFG
jgi:hypothetical protein